MSYELLEQSKREFKKDSRRVAIKVKALHFRWSYYASFFLKKLFFNFRIFLNAPKKKKSMHYWARIILRQHTLTKITNLARWDNLDFQTRLPRTVRGGLYAFSAVESASTGLLSVLVISSFFSEKDEISIWTGNYRYFRSYLQMRLKLPDASMKLVSKAQERFFYHPPILF